MKPASSNTILSYKIKLQSFLNNLAQTIKRISLKSWINEVSPFLEKCPYNNSYFSKFPPNLVLHSIEYLAVVSRSFSQREATPSDFKKVAKLYFDIENKNPYHKLILTDPQDPSEAMFLFLTDLSHKHFELQGLLGPHIWARELSIFADTLSRKSVGQSFFKGIGLNLSQWLSLTFLISCMLGDGRYWFKRDEALKDLSSKFLIPEPSIDFFLNSLSVTPEMLKKNYFKTRKDSGADLIKNIPSLFELHIPSIFLEKPFILLEPNIVWPPYKSIIPNASFRCLRRIMEEKFNPAFSDEFGTAFQEYVEKLCSLFPNSYLVTERDFKSSYGYLEGQKFCDLVLTDEKAHYIIECKSVEFNSRLVSHNAVCNSNYVVKIKEANSQICDFILSLKNNYFSRVLSLDRSKPVFPIILTYSGISLPNFPYFRKSVLKIDPCPLDCINPQIMDAESFEMLVTFAIKSNITLHDVLSDKLDKPYNIVGDWESYWRTLLKDEDKYLPFHADRFNTFCQSLKAFLS